MEEQKMEHQHLDKVAAASAMMPAVTDMDPNDENLVLHGKYGTTAIDDEEFDLTFKTYVIVASVSLLSLAVTLGIAGPTSLVTSIVRTVGEPTNATWIINSVNILQGVAGPPMALMADLYGRRWTLIAFTCSGVAGTFIAGSATSMGQVIAGQALTGVALALKPICYAIASEVLPRKYRALVQYWISILAGLGGLVGALVGPALLQLNAKEGWRWFFYLEGAIFILSLLGIIIFYKPPPRDVSEASRTIRERFLAFDWIGWFLLAAGFSLLVAGLAFGGNRFPWRSGQTLGPLIGGLLALTAFVLYEIYGRSDGLCHHALFKERNYALSLVGMALEGALLYAFLSIYSAQVLKVYTTNAFDQGLRTMPFWLASLIVCVPLAFLTTKYKDVKIQLAVGYLFFIIGSVLMATAKVSSSTQSVIADAIAGAGFAAPLTLLILVAQLCTPPALIATATALMSTSRALAGAVAVAIYSAIFTNKLQPLLGPSIAAAMIQAGLPAAQVAQRVPQVVASINAGYVPTLVPGVSPAILNAAYSAARESYVEAYRYVWICSACFGIPALASVYFMTPVRHHMNARIDAPAEDVHANFEKRNQPPSA